MWKFFATSHGKGVVDGIGGSAKACVRARVMSKDEKVVVQSASDFVKVASKDLKNVKIFEVTENDVAKNENIFDDCEDVPGIMKVHSIDLKEGTMGFYPNDLDRNLNCRVILERVFEEPKQTYKVGQWVEVKYQKKTYPGEIVTIGNEDVQVNVMHKEFAAYWKWPSPKDQIFYPWSAVVRKISLPVHVGNRESGQYKFEEMQ